MDVRVSLISPLLSSIKTYLFHYFKANEVLRIKFADIRREEGGGGGEYSPPIGLFSDLVSSHYQNSGYRDRVLSINLNKFVYFPQTTNKQTICPFPLYINSREEIFSLCFFRSPCLPPAAGIIRNISVMCINTKTRPPAPAPFPASLALTRIQNNMLGRPPVTSPALRE